jgi:rod shape-determining protein MreC
MNLNETQERIRWATFAFLATLSLILLVLDNTGNVDTFFEVVRDPMGRVLAVTARGSEPIIDAISGPRNLRDAQQEIEELRAQVNSLSRENEELREIQGQYQVLRDLFNTARQTPEYRRVVANVIGRDTSPTRQSIQIDKGRRDGVHVGQTVESSRGLVGMVYRTSEHTAQVILLSDSASEIPARLSNSRATGLVRGGGLGRPMRIEWVSLDARIEVGEVVLTSGIGGMFPPNMTIGRVIQVDRREAELHQRAVVQPAVDFNALETIFVIVNFEPLDTSLFESTDEP